LPYRVRLVCRFPPGIEGGWSKLKKTLSSAGWTVEGLEASYKDVSMKLMSSSTDGSELILNVAGGVGGDILDEFLKTVLPPCWYVDVYYYFRGSEAYDAAKQLSINFEEKGRSRVKLGGVELVVESYPAAEALTVSYRVGWSEGGKKLASKIHEKLMTGGKGKGVLSIWRWRR